MIETTQHSRHAFGMTILKNSHPDIRKLKRLTGNASIHGNKFWKSTFLMMDYLSVFPPHTGAKVLEVGCGWGLAGIYLAKHFQCELTSLDADRSVFPYLKLHAKLNQVSLETWCARYENIRKRDLAEFDLVIGADVCFWDEMTKPLYNLIRRSHQVGTRIVMTDPGRSPFREMSSLCVDNFECAYENWSVPHPHNSSGLVLDVGS